MTQPALVPEQEPVQREIRRYSNRKLYDTTERRFTSLSALENLVRDGVDFIVVDHQTGADHTEETLRRVLSLRRRDSAADNTELFFDLIRYPMRIAGALAESDRDVAELRELRQQVNSLSEILDVLLNESDDEHVDEKDAASND